MTNEKKLAAATVVALVACEGARRGIIPASPPGDAAETLAALALVSGGLALAGCGLLATVDAITRLTGRSISPITLGRVRTLARLGVSSGGLTAASVVTRAWAESAGIVSASTALGALAAAGVVAGVAGGEGMLRWSVRGLRRVRAAARARQNLAHSPFSVVEVDGALLALDAEGRALPIAPHRRGVAVRVAADASPLSGLTLGAGPRHGDIPGLTVVGAGRDRLNLLATPALGALARFVVGHGGRVVDGAIDWCPAEWLDGPASPTALLGLLEAARGVRRAADDGSAKHLLDGLADEPDPRWRLARIAAARRLNAAPEHWRPLLDGPPDIALTTCIVFTREAVDPALVEAALTADDRATRLCGPDLAAALAAMCHRAAVENPGGLVQIGDARLATRAVLLNVVLDLVAHPEPVVLRWLATLPSHAAAEALHWLESNGTVAALPVLTAWVDSRSDAEAARRAERAIRERSFPHRGGGLALSSTDGAGGDLSLSAADGALALASAGGGALTLGPDAGGRTPPHDPSGPLAR